MRIRQKARKILATAAIGVIALSMGTSVRAFADPSPLVDPNQTGSIIITKLQTPSSATDAANGLEQDITDDTPIDGVTYQITQVPGVDLTTNDGWVKAGSMAVADAEDAIATAAGTANAGNSYGPITTANGGVATFSDLPIGLYYVQETFVPTGYTSAEPFLVTIPITDPTDPTNWLYEVYAYPKDAPMTANKTISDASAVKLGDPVTYTITSSIPNMATIDGFKVTDELAAALTLATDESSNPEVTVSLSGTTITLDSTDYTLSTPLDAGATDNTVTVTFTDSGLKQLEAAVADSISAQLVVTITATVTATGGITNSATVYPNLTSQTPNNPVGSITTPPVTTEWGAIVISKVSSINASDGSAVPVPGAVFQVYASEEDANAQNNPIAIPDPVGSTNTIDKWTTDEHGAAVISGLRYSNWVDGAEVMDGGQPADCTATPTPAGCQVYWLVETTAPEGYALLAAPVPVLVLGNETDVPTTTIQNVPIAPNLTLPQTGARPDMRTYMAYVAGGVLLVGVVVAMAVGVRRRASVTNAR